MAEKFTEREKNILVDTLLKVGVDECVLAEKHDIPVRTLRKRRSELMEQEIEKTLSKMSYEDRYKEL